MNWHDMPTWEKAVVTVAGGNGRELERLGLVEWVPPIFGDTHTYAITEKGRAAVEAADNFAGLVRMK